MHDKFIPEKPDIATVTEVEMDENQKYYGRKTIAHCSKKLIGWALGRRDTKTLIKMYDSNVYSVRYGMLQANVAGAHYFVLLPKYISLTASSYFCERNLYSFRNDRNKHYCCTSLLMFWYRDVPMPTQ